MSAFDFSRTANATPLMSALKASRIAGIRMEWNRHLGRIQWRYEIGGVVPEC